MPKVKDRIGPYELTRKLGEGAFGEVWLARDSSGSSAREAAVKIPLKSDIDLDALLQEATLWARATGHANVLGFLAARVFDGQAVLVSEFAPDGSLKDWLHRHGGRAPSIATAVEMTLGILAGLEHLHARNIIHRDIKPDNVLLLDQMPRLADFGISRVLKTTDRSSITAGTPPYMAPEAFSRIRNQQTDLWSVGVILYQMLNGQLPFDGEDIAEIYGAVRNEDPKPLPSDVPAWLRQVVAKALAKEPALRYQTAAEMRAILTSQRLTLIGEKIQAPPDGETAATAPQAFERGTTAIAQPQPNHEPVAAESAHSVNTPTAGKSRRWAILSAELAFVIVLAVFLVMKLPAISQKVSGWLGGKPPLPDWGEAFTENLNGVKLEMVHVPGGEFLMGSPEEEAERSRDESPQHRVTVPALYIGKYEVTQAQWKTVMGSNPSNPRGGDLPVESVSWEDAKAFCKKLSGMTHKTYRLPSEAEWEYACRAGTTGAYASDVDTMAWYTKNSGGKAHPVGEKQPNAFKLYDMHGNVWEWCEDVYHDSFGGRNGDPPGDGSAWLKGGDQSNRILRGGAWRFASRYARSANRGRGLPDAHVGPYGLRVVASATPQ